MSAEVREDAGAAVAREDTGAVAYVSHPVSSMVTSSPGKVAVAGGAGYIMCPRDRCMARVAVDGQKRVWRLTHRDAAVDARSVCNPLATARCARIFDAHA